MKPIDFDLHRPDTTDEALAVLTEHPMDSKVLAGGQSLVPLLNFRLARPQHVVDLSRIASLAELRRTHDELIVGAMVRQATAEHSPAVAGHAPLLLAAFPNIAHPPIRNRGTVGGSLAHGDPAAELPAVARALDATFVATGQSGRREIGAAEFFRGNLMTALADDEILTEIRFARAAPGTGAAFLEVARRRGDFALVGVAAQITVDSGVLADVRICFSGVAPAPHRASEAESVLTGQRFERRWLDQAADAVRASIEPHDDLHGTGAYRKDVAGVLLTRALTEAHRRAVATAATAA